MTASGDRAQRRQHMGSELRLRIASGLILAGVTLFLTGIGGLPFRILAAAIGAAILYEWVTMTRSRMDSRHVVVLSVALAALLLLLVFGAGAAAMLAVLAVGAVAAAVHASIARCGAWGPAGLVYAGLSAVALSLLRGGEWSGLWTILFLFAVVWATDILAYFVGRAVGGPKLAPAISPGKTWSGAAGGTLAGVIAGLAVWYFGDPRLPAASFALLALALSVVSQVGDLFESWIKRRFSFKDSSRLIPGHGGVMDRVDGLVAAAVLLLALAVLLAGPDAPSQALFLG